MIDTYINRLRKGAFLTASNQLVDPHFEKTILFICQHNADGTYGLILNRIAHMPLGEVFNVDPPWRVQNKKFYMGGPVSTTELQILHLTQTPAAKAMEILPGLYLGGLWEDIEPILRTEAPEMRLFLGYTGWAGGQLEQEIRGGSWEVYEGDPLKLLSTDPEPWHGDSNSWQSFFS